ncbi:hypothetical protein RRG08_039320 [Elysia crispata]|uniref:Methyltransferase type 11 domain-containing protein n=1 Tax=Elysia crispata TaxID=231223 RepID=A0AAE1D330_9GAST|nr:hypothetical protein RRG08_039320 [Elysia crispata]
MRWDTPGLNFSLFQTDPDLHTKTKPWTPPFSLSTHTWRREMLTSRKCFRAWTILRSTPSTGPDTLTSCLRQSLTTARRPTLTSTWPWILGVDLARVLSGLLSILKKLSVLTSVRPRSHAHQKTSACAPNCEFKVGNSDKLPFIEAGTVDLFCCGSSFHWLPQKETLAEADRVLKPGGTIAIFGYDVPRCDIPEVEACLQSIWARIFPFAPKETAQALGRCRGLELPYPGLIRNDEMKLQMNYTVEHNIEFLRSTRATRAYMEAHPTQDFLGDLAEELRQALHTSGAGDIYSVTFNLYLLMVHKPMN